MLYRLLFAAILGLALIGGCKSNTEMSGEEGADSTNAFQDSISEAIKRLDKEGIAQIVDEWNSKHTIAGINELGGFYADEVSYFGNPIKREELVEAKKSYIAANEVESSEIANVIVEPAPLGAKVTFTRTIKKKIGMETQNGYIVLTQQYGPWKIVTESDMQKDMQRIEQGARPMSEGEITSCDKAAEALFRSSPPVQGMLRSPNAQMKVEYKPGDPDNPNGRYWYWIYGSPRPEMKADTYGRFQLDPTTKELYLYDPVRNMTTPMPTDPKYKKYMDKFCGK